MKKKLISLLLVFCLAFGISCPIFAANDNNTGSPSLIEADKNILNIGENKLVTWEIGDNVYVDQYDAEGNLVESCIGNRNTGEIISVKNDIVNSMNAYDFITINSKQLLPSFYAYSNVGSFPVFNTVTLARQTMRLYQDVGSASRTTYTTGKYNGTLAGFVTSIALGLTLPTVVASAVAQVFIGTGLAVLVDKTVSATFSSTLAADKYDLKYYGQDTKTLKKSDVYDKTDKYIIKETGSSKFNEVFYDGSSYYDPDDDTPTTKLMQYIVPNLYGTDYEWDNY